MRMLAALRPQPYIDRCSYRSRGRISELHGASCFRLRSVTRETDGCRRVIYSQFIRHTVSLTVRCTPPPSALSVLLSEFEGKSSSDRSRTNRTACIHQSCSESGTHKRLHAAWRRFRLWVIVLDGIQFDTQLM